MKKPKLCKECPNYHSAGHKQGTALHNSKYDNWCCKYATVANKAISICIQNKKHQAGSK